MQIYGGLSVTLLESQLSVICLVNRIAGLL